MSRFKPIIHPWNKTCWSHLISDQERSNHALLLTGHTGLGKLDLAFALAHHVITAKHTQSSNLFDSGSHPDMHVLMPENKALALAEIAAEGDPRTEFAKRYLEQHGGKPRRVINIDQVRKLASALTTHPHISSHRVVLIANAETLNRNAANGLLKNLEEPPAKTLFILVSDEISKLPKTVRSRCSLIKFSAPEYSIGHAWLQKQAEMPDHEIATHLAMANNQPLHALRLFRQDYVASLKSVFNDVNGLWNQRRLPLDVAKNWQQLGGQESVQILQKLCTDLLRSRLSKEPHQVFFPVQQTWVQSVAPKLSDDQLLVTLDELAQAKRLLDTTVDELLVLESLSNHVRQLPRDQ
jgi:DNA polymerase-3 subunit delta'